MAKNHSAIYLEAKESAKEKDKHKVYAMLKETIKQSTLEFTPKKIWDNNHLNSRKIHQKDMNFISLDN